MPPRVLPAREQWAEPHVSGPAPDLRWGHSMSSFRQWVVVFGGHRKRGCLNDTVLLNTDTMAWEAVGYADDVRPPSRGNHAAALVGARLWVFGGDAANAGVLAHDAWALHLDGQGSQKHEAGLMAATSRLVRAVPYLFYVPAPAQRGRY